MTDDPSGQIFTQKQVTAASGLHGDLVRQLITWGAVKPARGGRGRGNVRGWTPAALVRVAVTAAVFNATGLSLRTAHAIASSTPLEPIYDEIRRALAETPAAPEWRRATEPHDLLIEIVDRRYALARMAQGGHWICTGRIDDEGRELLSAAAVPHVDVAAAEAAPVSRLTINVSLAARLAVRKAISLSAPVVVPQNENAAPRPSPDAASAVMSHRGGNPGNAPTSRPECRSKGGIGQPGAHGSPQSVSEHDPTEDEHDDRHRPRRAKSRGRAA